VSSRGDRRRRAPLGTAALLVGLAAVALVAAATGGPPRDGAGAEETVAPEPHRDAVGADEADPLDELVAVWTRSRLPEGYAATVLDDERFDTTLVRSGTYPLLRTLDADGEVVDELPDGWWYPVELVAVEPHRYDALLGRELVADLAPDEALLSRSSAQVRGLGEGAALEFDDGVRFTVAAVVDDELVGAGEVVVRADAPLVPDWERYLLVRPDPELGDREEVVAALTSLLPEDRPLGTAFPDEVPVLRNSAGVLAPARMKAHFGEFAIRDVAGRGVEVGASWARDHVTTEAVPILGRVTCHREVFPPLRAAMQDLVERDLAHLVDRGDYGGCWIGRTQGGEHGPLSSHAWGVSIDLNVTDNFLGMEPSQDHRLVEVMARHGFAWGGEWLVPDAMHFELVPDREVAVPEPDDG
jgi:hypothetical protein